MVSLEAHEYEERRGEDEHERAEREPQRDATDRSGIGAQLLEDELAAWAIETEARSDTEAARATGGAALTLTPTLTLTRHRAEAALSTAAPAGRERDAPERRVVHGLKQVVQRQEGASVAREPVVPGRYAVCKARPRLARVRNKYKYSVPARASCPAAAALYGYTSAQESAGPKA